jgi:hypothetical protein
MQIKDFKMTYTKKTLLLLVCCFSLNANLVLADYQHPSKSQKVQDIRQDHRQNNRQDNRVEHRQDVRQIKRKISRNRVYRNVVVIRPHGRIYSGYGAFHNDNDAYKWLAFTAITLKILDNINEEAQRKHERAQVLATSAQVGEKISWHTADASGYVVTNKIGTNTNSLTCREFQQVIKVGGKTEKAYGRACLQADGAWKIV